MLTTARVQIPAWTCEKDTSDFSLGFVFHRLLWFLPPLTTGKSRISLNIAEKITKIENQIQIQVDQLCFHAQIV